MCAGNIKSMLLFSYQVWCGNNKVAYGVEYGMCDMTVWYDGIDRN